MEKFSKMISPTQFILLIVFTLASLVLHAESLQGLAKDQAQPSFTTSGKTIRVATKDTIVLPCEVINLGKYALAWKRGSSILTAGSVRISPDERISLVNGYNLEIRDVDTNDAGDYICHIATLQPKEITHTVEVLVPARVRRVTTSSNVEVRKGSSVTLECEASGNPVPTVVWTRKNSLLPSGEKSASGSSYTIEDANKHHSGIYVCTAYNSVGPPASDQIALQVHYAPEVEIPNSWIHTGEGYEVELVCLVHAEPSASVIWYRNTLRLDTTERLIMENRGSRHALIIRKVESSDFGNYSCVADNSMGKTRQHMYLSGKPHKAVFLSKPESPFRTSYNISWYVESYTPIDEYKLSYHEVPDRVQNYQQHYNFQTNQYDIKHSRRDNEMKYGIGDEYSRNMAMYKDHWINVTLPAVPSDKNVQAISYMITDLDAATQYEARVQARNRFGWSEISEPHKFYTKGIELTDGGEHSEPEMRDLGVKALSEASECTNLILLNLLSVIFLLIPVYRF